MQLLELFCPLEHGGSQLNLFAENYNLRIVSVSLYTK
jgi:hypothetical protein